MNSRKWKKKLERRKIRLKREIECFKLRQVYVVKVKCDRLTS